MARLERLQWGSYFYDSGIHLQQRLPGLDGLRALAVTLVVAYHLWPEVLPGGFLGVTVFFALSGFLITRLLCAERDRTGRVAIGAFYQRRVRRLLPASLLVLAVVVVIWTLAGWMTAQLRVETNFTLLQLANWGQIVEGHTYGTGEVASPIMHYWSLAIEEQAYLVLPLLVAVVARRRIFAAIVVGGLAVSITTTMWWAGDRTVVYFATFTRMGEILAGAALALVSLERIGPSLRRALPLVAAIAVAVILVAARTWSVETAVVYRGGLLAIGAVSAVLVLAIVAMPHVGRMMDIAPVRWVGEHSYGIYLIHWPLLVGLALVGLARPVAAVLTVVGTLALAALMARIVERPIRAGALTWRPLMAGVAVSALVVLGVAGVGERTRLPAIDFEALSRESAELVSAQIARQEALESPSVTRRPMRAPVRVAPAVASAAPTAPGLVEGVVEGVGEAVSIWDEVLTYSYFGDSKAVTLSYGLLLDPPERWRLGPIHRDLGCPLGRGGERRHRVQPSGYYTWDVANCNWSASLAFQWTPEGLPTPIDVAVIWAGTWDVVEARVPGHADTWTTIRDPQYRDWLRSEIEEMVELLVSQHGARLVVLLRTPPSAFSAHGDVEAWNGLVDEAALAHPEVLVLDIAAWAHSIGEAETLIPDGVHLGIDPSYPAEAARRVHEEYLDVHVRLALDGGR